MKRKRSTSLSGEPSDATWAAEMMVILLHYAELFSKTGLDIKYEWLLLFISLHLKGHGRIQQSASQQLGIGGAAYQNTAHTKTWVNAASEMVQNSFMAEKTTGANAWVIGAAASAVAGLALLGFSLRKKQSTVVEV